MSSSCLTPVLEPSVRNKLNFILNIPGLKAFVQAPCTKLLLCCLLIFVGGLGVGGRACIDIMSDVLLEQSTQLFIKTKFLSTL